MTDSGAVNSKLEALNAKPKFTICKYEARNRDQLTVDGELRQP